MKIASSLKSLKKRDLNSKLVRRRGRVYIINKRILNLKQDKNNISFYDNSFTIRKTEIEKEYQ